MERHVDARVPSWNYCIKSAYEKSREQGSAYSDSSNVFHRIWQFWTTGVHTLQYPLFLIHFDTYGGKRFAENDVPLAKSSDWRIVNSTLIVRTPVLTLCHLYGCALVFFFTYAADHLPVGRYPAPITRCVEPDRCHAEFVRQQYSLWREPSPSISRIIYHGLLVFHHRMPFNPTIYFTRYSSNHAIPICAFYGNLLHLIGHKNRDIIVDDELQNLLWNTKVFIAALIRRPNIRKTQKFIYLQKERKVNFCSYRYTWSVQKVSRILYFFKTYLFFHEYLFYPLQSNTHQKLYTCANVFFAILEALQKIIFCDLVKLLLRCRLYLLNRGVASSVHELLQFWEQEKVTGGQVWGIRWLQHH